MSEFDFSHIAPVKTVPLSLGAAVRWPPDNPKSIVLQVRYAGDGNDGFVNARHKTPVPQDRAAQYARIAKLLARHVIVGWENVNNQDGSPLGFTPELAERLLLALLEHKRTDVIDYVRIFAADADNFHEPSVDPIDLGKG